MGVVGLNPPAGLRPMKELNPALWGIRRPPLDVERVRPGRIAPPTKYQQRRSLKSAKPSGFRWYILQTHQNENNTNTLAINLDVLLGRALGCTGLPRNTNSVDAII